MSYCPSVHVLTSIASVANALCVIKLLYNGTVSMVTDAIRTYLCMYIRKYVRICTRVYYTFVLCTLVGTATSQSTGAGDDG